jgi:hypothetical protein
MPPRPWIRSASNPVTIGEERLVPPLTWLKYSTWWCPMGMDNPIW